MKQETEESGVGDNIGDDRTSMDCVYVADQHSDLYHSFNTFVDMDETDVLVTIVVWYLVNRRTAHLF